jgi:diguanylate cyclase (GGDEF)-like protein/PAS domain S-box-containing protein
MPAVLLIESSATQRRLQADALRAAGLEVRQAGTPAALGAGPQAADGVDALLIGWPAEAFGESLLERLASPPWLSRPVLFVLHDPDPLLQAYTRERPGSAAIMAEQQRIAARALRRMLETAVAPAPPGADGVRVLLVDAAPGVARYYQRLLRSSGYRADRACGVDEALQRVQATRYELVLVDYDLQGGRGAALCRALQARGGGSAPHIAAMLGSYREEAIRASLEAGALECLFKGEPDALFLTRVHALARVAHSQKAVAAERSRLAAILGSVGDGVYGVDREGLVTFVNEAARRILGLESEEEVLGAPAQSVLHPMDSAGYAGDGAVYSMADAYASGEALGSRETLFRHRGGRLLPVECTVYPLLDGDRRDGSVVAFRDISGRKSMEARLRWQASHDPLTELFNRSYFEAQIERELRRRPGGRELLGAVFHIDLDQFRYLNDVGGHGAGDRLLVEVANRLRAYFRSHDLVARLDGDEFAVLAHVEARDQALSIAEGVGNALQGCSFDADGKRYTISAAVGVALVGADYASAAECLAQAEAACQLAKRKGRNQYHVHDPQAGDQAPPGHDLGWAHRLTAALHEGALSLFYQPILALSDVDASDLPDEPGRLWSQSPAAREYYEVLLRLRGEDGGLISPQTFVPIAERFNLMPEIDHWVLSEVVAQLRRLQDQGRQGVVLSVNLSARTLSTPSVLPRMKALLDGAGICPGSLIFEVTETAGIEDLDAARWFINELRAEGYRFALDDFGTGFSSFSHLKLLPADILKIDGHFIRGMRRDAIDRSIVTAMNEIAHSLDLVTVAEYVESAETLRQLLACGVDYVQGNYIALPSRALPSAGEGRSKPALRLISPSA